MYKWPQGRVLRIVAMILIAVIAADVAYNGAYKDIGAWLASTERPTRQIAIGSLYAVLAAGIIIAGLACVGFIRRSVDFLIDVEQEMVRVEWPKPNQLMRSTFVVAVVLTVVTLMVLGVDAICIYVYRDLIPGWGG
jgi:preprotein translocase SecE subunit